MATHAFPRRHASGQAPSSAPSLLDEHQEKAVANGHESQDAGRRSCVAPVTGRYHGDGFDYFPSPGLLHKTSSFFPFGHPRQGSGKDEGHGHKGRAE